LGRSGILILNAGEYFQGVVAGAVTSLKLEVSDHAQLYLAQLLGYFIKMENFYPVDAEGRRADTLAQQLAVALEQESAEERAKRMRQLGDFSLYVAGFFTESFQRKAVDVDYYIGMGGAAYESAARLEDKKAKSDLFFELARRFPDFVEVLSQISEETGFHPSNDKDLLRMYDLWARTGSGRLARKLAKAGIVPSAPKTSTEGNEDS
jgi:hypothetical protein